jgi:DNA-binding response OmpR family regulator
MNILLYENSSYARVLIQKNLVQFKQSLQVVSTHNVENLIYEFNRASYDLIIIDVDNNMLKFLPLLKSSNKHNIESVVILLTSYNNHKICQRFKKYGIDYCLDKVSEFEELLKKVEELFEQMNSAMKQSKYLFKTTQNRILQHTSC